MLVCLLMLVLRVVMLLVIVVSCLGIQTLAIRVARLLHIYTDTARTRLFRHRTRCRRRSWWWLEHGRIFEGLRDSAIVRAVAIVLLSLRICIIGVWKWVALLGPLASSRLGLSSTL